MSELSWGVALVVGLAALLVGEVRGGLALRAPSKVVASTAFIGLAVAHGSLGGPTGAWLLAALCLCWLGDVLLLGASRPAFLAGLVAFLLGHAAYVGGFATAGWSPGVAGLAAAVLAVPAGFVFRWLRPKLPPPMVAPVVAYTAVITAMVAGAVGRVADGGSPRILVAAGMFYVSDLAVARNRFVAPGPINRLWGLPLYYGAMALLALGI